MVLKRSIPRCAKGGRPVCEKSEERNSHAFAKCLPFSLRKKRPRGGGGGGEERHPLREISERYGESLSGRKLHLPGKRRKALSGRARNTVLRKASIPKTKKNGCEGPFASHRWRSSSSRKRKGKREIRHLFPQLKGGVLHPPFLGEEGEAPSPRRKRGMLSSPREGIRLGEVGRKLRY